MEIFKLKAAIQLNLLIAQQHLTVLPRWIFVNFLIAAKAKGVSYFKNLSELNEKSRLKWGSKILNKIGIKTKTTKHSIKIFGNPELKVTKGLR